MAGGWRDSNRRSRLPADWPQLVAAVKRRSGGKCEVRRQSKGGAVCGRPADGGVDHIIPNDDNSLANLQDTCSWHHRKKSSQEGQAAKLFKKGYGKLPAEQHPGRRRRA